MYILWLLECGDGHGQGISIGKQPGGAAAKTIQAKEHRGRDLPARRGNRAARKTRDDGPGIRIAGHSARRRGSPSAAKRPATKAQGVIVDLRYLLDTNICIYIRQSRPPEVLKRFQKLRPGEAVLSVITFGELLYGAARSTKLAEAVARLEELRRLLPVLPLDESVADAYGAIRADLESRGERIGNNDLWIAAHSLATSLVLVTNNESEFSRVKGLKVQNCAA